MRKEAASQLDAGEMIDRLRKVFAVRTDVQLSEHINASVSAISNWRTRNAAPYAVLATVAGTRGVSLDWLVFGTGEGSCARPCTEEQVNLRTAQANRITQFVEFWDRTRTDEEVIWLEQQIKRNVTEYRDWLPSDSKTPG